jgi:hypothetical protein
MHCKYLDQDFEQRMNGGVAYYDGKPVIVGASRGLITIVDFPEQINSRNIRKDDEKLDLTSPSLGYVNFKNHAYYVYRKPERKYKQTLTYGSVGLYDPSSNKPVTERAEALFYSKEMAAMFAGIYPKVGDVLKVLGSDLNKVKARAIDRDVCIAKDSYGILRVYYKFDEVGHINVGETIVRVPHTELAWVVSKYLKVFGWQVD